MRGQYVYAYTWPGETICNVTGFLQLEISGAGDSRATTRPRNTTSVLPVTDRQRAVQTDTSSGTTTMTNPIKVPGELLRNSAFFSHFSDIALERLANAFVAIMLEPGQVLFEKGDLGDALYIITDGTVRIHDGDLVLSRIGPGTIFGEVAALDQSPRTASITAETSARLLSLDRQTLFGLTANELDVTHGIIMGLCDRLRARIEDIADVTLHQKMLEHELAIGRTIQAGFLPQQLPDIPGWCIAAYFQAAREVSGDFYDVFVHKCGRVALVVGDVCDKGVGAALFMTLFRSLIRAGANMEDFLSTTRTDPSRESDHNAVLRQGLGLANAYISRTHGDTSMFATVFFGLLDPRSGHLAYINAGHETPYISRHDGRIEALEATGPAVGLMAAAQFGVGESILEEGDAITAYTDGVTDARDAAGAAFSDAQLRELIGAGRGPATGLVNRVSAALERHGEGAKQFDDITLLMAARNAL